MTLDPVELDPRHYHTLFENDRVRTLRVRYGPHEASPMHTHPPSVALFLTDLHFKDTAPSGGTSELHARAGEVQWLDAAEHRLENLTSESLEIVMIELKGEPEPP